MRVRRRLHSNVQQTQFVRAFGKTRSFRSIRAVSSRDRRVLARIVGSLCLSVCPSVFLSFFSAVISHFVRLEISSSHSHMNDTHNAFCLARRMRANANRPAMAWNALCLVLTMVLGLLLGQR